MQTGLVKALLSMAGDWSLMTFKVPSNPNHSVVLCGGHKALPFSPRFSACSAYCVCSPTLPAAAVHPSMPAGSVQRGTALWLSRAVSISEGRSAQSGSPIQSCYSCTGNDSPGHPLPLSSVFPCSRTPQTHCQSQNISASSSASPWGCPAGCLWSPIPVGTCSPQLCDAHET